MGHPTTFFFWVKSSHVSFILIQKSHLQVEAVKVDRQVNVFTNEYMTPHIDHLWPTCITKGLHKRIKIRKIEKSTSKSSLAQKKIAWKKIKN